MLRSTHGAMRALLAAVLLLQAAGCASGARSTSPRGGSRTTLTCDDFRSVNGASTAYDLVQRLRPTWLQVRGRISFHSEPPIGLVVDGRASETFAQLQEIPSLGVTRIERLGANEAKVYGQYPQGAISVTTGTC